MEPYISEREVPQSPLAKLVVQQHVERYPATSQLMRHPDWLSVDPEWGNFAERIDAILGDFDF